MAHNREDITLDKIPFMSHPKYDNHPCARCDANNVETRVYYIDQKSIPHKVKDLTLLAPKWLCRNCMDDLQDKYSITQDPWDNYIPLTMSYAPTKTQQ